MFNRLEKKKPEEKNIKNKSAKLKTLQWEWEILLHFTGVYNPPNLKESFFIYVFFQQTAGVL
jgi:hypothetical protein